MIIAEFFKTEDDSFKGFHIRGHSGYSERGSDIVCAGVSSAVMLTINTAVEFFGVSADVSVISDGDISCDIREITGDSDRLIKSLMAHLSELSQEFPKNIKVMLSLA